MAPGKYELVRNENYIEYMTALGGDAGGDIAKKLADSKATLTVSVDGGKYTLTSESGSTTPHVISFVSGESFEENILKGVKINSVGSVSGNKITIVSSSSSGKSGERVYDFTDDGVTITYTSKLTSVVAKRIYKKV